MLGQTSDKKVLSHAVTDLIESFSSTNIEEMDSEVFILEQFGDFCVDHLKADQVILFFH